MDRRSVGAITGGIAVRPLTALADQARAEREMDAVFFAASSVQSFGSEAERRAFRARWLGRYLDTERPLAQIACAGADDRVIGYLVGALADPARDPRFSDLGFLEAFAPLTAVYPAHLHVNVAADARGAGLGARLLEAFAAVARRAGAPGVHVVTGQGLRNVGFYLRNGFAEAATTSWNGKTVVLLARPL